MITIILKPSQTVVKKIMKHNVNLTLSLVFTSNTLLLRNRYVKKYTILNICCFIIIYVFIIYRDLSSFLHITDHRLMMLFNACGGIPHAYAAYIVF